MSAQSLAVLATGLVTSVGIDAPTACAAIRSKLTNPSETRFIDLAGEAIVGHVVALGEPVRGLTKLARMAVMAIDECLTAVPHEQWPRIPILLCVAEPARPGRLQGLEGQLVSEVVASLGNIRLAHDISIVPYGRVSIAVALSQARKVISETDAPAVLIVATDSLLTWPTLRLFEGQERLLTRRNSNGFVPGEAASAVLVARSSTGPHLSIRGLGFATESASVGKEEPLRAEGLSQAIRQSLNDAGCTLHELDFRIADVSGEQYYFKEAALAFARTLRGRKEEFDIWHPAECIGEVGSAIGPIMLAVAEASGRKAYAPGPAILIHGSNDSGERAAIVTHFVVR